MLWLKVTGPRTHGMRQHGDCHPTPTSLRDAGLAGDGHAIAPIRLKRVGSPASVPASWQKASAGNTPLASTRQGQSAQGFVQWLRDPPSTVTTWW